MKVIDEGLLEATQLPDRPAAKGAFTVALLFKSQSQRLVRFLAHRLRNHEDAQDASQEVFLRLWRQEQSGHLQDEATAYLFSAARSISIDQQRWRQSHCIDQTLDLDEGGCAELPDPLAAPADESLHWRKGVEALVSCIRELPLRTQQVFILCTFEGLTQGDAARRLGIDIRTAERHVAQAMAHCKKRLKDYL